METSNFLCTIFPTFFFEPRTIAKGIVKKNFPGTSDVQPLVETAQSLDVCALGTCWGSCGSGQGRALAWEDWPRI